jgi:hypothetical protein
MVRKTDYMLATDKINIVEKITPTVPPSNGRTMQAGGRKSKWVEVEQ